MKKILRFLLLINCISLCGCANNSPSTAVTQTASTAGTVRDNTPYVLVPSADGKDVIRCETAVIDISNTDQGYCMVEYKGNSEKVKFQLTTPESVTYTYTLHSGYETFPLTGGSGTYQVTVFEHAHDDIYTTALADSFEVALENEFNPYLYPNQYVNFLPDSNVITKGEELAKGAVDDLAVVTNVYNYVAANITYDQQKAETVESGYLPVVDDILESGTGICFDYAAVMASMLRSQNIPTRLEVGYAKDAYHAWVSVYLTEIGWVNGIIEFDGKDWELMDPTFAAAQSEKKLKKFIGDGNNYLTKYVY